MLFWKQEQKDKMRGRNSKYMGTSVYKMSLVPEMAMFSVQTVINACPTLKRQCKRGSAVYCITINCF